MVRTLFSTLVLMAAAVLIVCGAIVADYWIMLAGILLVGWLLEGR